MSATKKPTLGNNLNAAAQALGADDTDLELPEGEAPQLTEADRQARILKLQAELAALQAETTEAPIPNENDVKAILRAQPKVRIIVDETDHTPPNGHFVSVNGYAYQIRTGQEVDVPVAVLEVLDHAIESVPVTDDMKSVVGFRDRMRVPYRVVRYLDA